MRRRGAFDSRVLQGRVAAQVEVAYDTETTQAGAAGARGQQRDPREQPSHGRSWRPVQEPFATRHFTPPLHSEVMLTCLSDGFDSSQRILFFAFY